jgi:hypothetical protein
MHTLGVMHIKHQLNGWQFSFGFLLSSCWSFPFLFFSFIIMSSDGGIKSGCNLFFVFKCLDSSIVLIGNDDNDSGTNVNVNMGEERNSKG